MCQDPEAESEILAAISEMAEQQYICSVDDYDAEGDLYLVTWTDNASREWGFWGTRGLVEALFEKAVLH